MKTISWDESLETGYKLIDDQHRQTIELIDYLSDPKIKNGDVLDLLEKIFDFTLVHFLTEEELMEEVRYPANATKAMVKQHQEFKSYVRLRILEFRKSNDLDIISFQKFALDFLIIHEFGMDRELVAWIKGQKEESAA